VQIRAKSVHDVHGPFSGAAGQLPVARRVPCRAELPGQASIEDVDYRNPRRSVPAIRQDASRRVRSRRYRPCLPVHRMEDARERGLSGWIGRNGAGVETLGGFRLLPSRHA
jgi:hypothetical protein